MEIEDCLFVDTMSHISEKADKSRYLRVPLFLLDKRIISFLFPVSILFIFLSLEHVEYLIHLMFLYV